MNTDFSERPDLQALCGALKRLGTMFQLAETLLFQPVGLTLTTTHRS
jgi:hypothetical protein